MPTRIYFNTPPSTVPLETPMATAQWNRTITYEDYTKMLQGHKPQAMEDKWAIKTEAPQDTQGNAVLHVYLGWTRHEQISLEIAVGDPNKTDVEDWATIIKISWKVEHPHGHKVSEEEAKTMAVGLCNHLLGCALEEEDEEEDEDTK
jgi:hypothetical protein